MVSISGISSILASEAIVASSILSALFLAPVPSENLIRQDSHQIIESQHDRGR